MVVKIKAKIACLGLTGKDFYNENDENIDGFTWRIPAVRLAVGLLFGQALFAYPCNKSKTEAANTFPPYSMASLLGVVRIIPR
jgi:hypothetical protein